MWTHHYFFSLFHFFDWSKFQCVNLIKERECIQFSWCTFIRATITTIDSTRTADARCISILDGTKCCSIATWGCKSRRQKEETERQKRILRSDITYQVPLFLKQWVWEEGVPSKGVGLEVGKIPRRKPRVREISLLPPLLVLLLHPNDLQKREQL